MLIASFSDIFMVSGKVDARVLPVLCEASLTGIQRICGGIRTIAVGNIFRRIATKIICRRLNQEVSSKIRTYQLYFAVRGDSGGSVQLFRDFISKDDFCKVPVKLDFTNAFNAVRRDVLLETVNCQIPAYFPL